jgi:glycosyltransferase involved in cell wall biosynthesis
VGYKYAETLSQRHAVTVLAAHPARAPADTELHVISAGNCNFNDVAAASLARFEIGQFPRAWRLHQENRFDVVHRVTPSWIGNSSMLPALRAPFVIGPLLASEPPPEKFRPVLNRVANGQVRSRFHPRRLSAGIAGRARDWLSRRHYHLRSARRILVGTQIAFDRIPLALRGKCELLPYSGVELEFFGPPVARPMDQPLHLLYVGRLVPYKGLELLLRALDAGLRSCEMRLRVVGSGNTAYGQFCRQLVKSLNLGRAVEFIPVVARPNLLRLYQQADVFCFPTLCDTYGVALLEAMSCGCPVVTSDTSGPREIVRAAFGFKVPLCNPEQYIHDFAEALVTLARDARLRQEMGHEARRQVELHHDWQAIGRRLLVIYESLNS